jgi:hypothetical protein
VSFLGVLGFFGQVEFDVSEFWKALSRDLPDVFQSYILSGICVVDAGEILTRDLPGVSHVYFFWCS